MALCGGKPQIKWICGLLMIFLVLTPLGKMDMNFIWQWTDEIGQQAEQITSQAEGNAFSQLQEGIIQRTKTYILDEAKSLGADVQVISLKLEDDGLLPVRIELKGTVSPYQRKVLSDLLQKDLGIGKEGQIWTD